MTEPTPSEVWGTYASLVRQVRCECGERALMIWYDDDTGRPVEVECNRCGKTYGLGKLNESEH